MDSFSAYMPVDRRHALARGQSLPEQTQGAALITDISGFTKLTEALVTAFGFQRGSEELSQHLNNVYGVLIAEVLRYHGSVISAAGDSLLSWFDGDKRDTALCALTAAFAMQKALSKFSTVTLPNGESVHLAIKSAINAGNARRFLVGDSQSQYFEVLVGALLDQLDAIEDFAKPGEVMLVDEIAASLGNDISLVEKRFVNDQLVGAVVEKLNHRSEPQLWSPLQNSIGKEQAKPWLHPAVYNYINSGQEMFFAELRPAVAMFIGFEGIDYDRDPHASDQLGAFFEWVQKNVIRYDGTLMAITTGDKGSNIYVSFGTPYAHEDDSSRAVALAQTLLSIPASLNFINKVQIGISRGTIWSGPIGMQDWRTFSAIGNDVNLAARLMQLAEPGQMLVSQRVAEMTGDTYQWQKLRELPVRGLSTPVSVFRLSAQKITAPVAQSSFRHNIVGREAERTALKEMLTTPDVTQSRVAIIEGDAGIGKSSLIADFLSLAHANQVQVLAGSGNAIEQSTPYYAWRPIFENLFGLDGDDRIQRASQWMKERDPKLIERTPLLSPVLSLDIQDNELTAQMSGQVRADNTRALLVEILGLHLGESANVLVIEDAHWLDSSSLALLQDVARNLNQLMIVVTTRPPSNEAADHLSAVRDLPQTKYIRLEQMQPQDITALICQRLNVSVLPDPVVNLIQNKAEGNPFFSEELAYSLKETGAILILNGECRVAQNYDLETLKFPDTVQGVIRSRIDRLIPAHQLALKAASVVGRIFALRAVHEIYPLHQEKSQLKDYFEYLRKLDLTPLNGELPDITYLFKHIITQEVAYNLMPFSQRQAFHKDVAVWYEKTFKDDLSPYYGVLAYHWNRASKPQEAIEYLEKAGEQAMINFANREAIEFFEEALRLARSEPVKVSALRRAHWERQLAEAYYGLGDLPKSLEHLKRSINIMGWQTPEKGLELATSLLGEVIKQIGFRIRPQPIDDTKLPTYLDDTEQAKLLEGAIAFVRLGHIYYQMNQPVLLIFGTLHAINLAERSGLKSPILARCYTNMCITSGVLARHDWAIAYRDRAHATARDVNDLSSLSYALAGCAVYEVGAALWESASKSLDEAIEIDSRLGDMRHLIESTSILSLVRFHQGDFKHGLESVAQGLEPAIQRKDIIPQIWLHALRAEILLRKSEPATMDDAITEYESTLQLLEQNIDQASDIRASGALAFAYWKNNEAPRALELAAATAKKTTSNPTAPYSIEGYAGVAEVFLSAWERGDAQYRSDAQKACQAMNKYTGIFPLGVPRARLYWGWFHWLDGKHQQALTDWRQCLADAEKLNLPYEQARALSFLGEHVESAGDRKQFCERALGIFERLGINYK
jgi:class 3 adenylate cyclase/tetratricopeptide (TPR) repeat protein